MGDDENTDALQTNSCYWCDKPMPGGNYEGIITCSRCQQMLRFAGISDEEIFGKKEL